ncbi:hypothetical protein GSbR_38620 [Geobacter sp. SVR]|nr:hypothetical protein GSVR_36450 [Geobacter sp. SVR]GCF87262.1 hypothetical protein GSbR_38620 [Geobacter sp. SVR]
MSTPGFMNQKYDEQCPASVAGGNRMVCHCGRALSREDAPRVLQSRVHDAMV